MSGRSGMMEPGALGQFREGVGQDLLVLAALHDRELDVERIAVLRGDRFPAGLALKLESAPGRDALQLMLAAVDILPDPADGRGLDALAADYADIYLTYKLHASPYESVWTDEDGLIMQESMFEVREWYRRHGLAAGNWRIRADDHLVLQLQFIRHLLVSPAEGDLGEAARFMDEHLLRWIGDFAARVSARSATPFYAGLAALTAAYVEELRDLLAELLGEPRPAPELIEEKMLEQRKAGAAAARVADIPVVSIPATTPSW